MCDMCSMHVSPSPPPAQVVSGLKPATNYSVLFAVSSGPLLVQTVTVVSGVLTPDSVSPSFLGVGGIGESLQLGVQAFTLRLPVAVDKPADISYAIYRCVYVCVLFGSRGMRAYADHCSLGESAHARTCHRSALPLPIHAGT